MVLLTMSTKFGFATSLFSVTMSLASEQIEAELTRVLPLDFFQE